MNKNTIERLMKFSRDVADPRFADTPETNAHLGGHANSPDDTAMWLEIGLPRRFERERDEARKFCRYLWDLASAGSRIEGMESLRLLDNVPEWIHSENR